MDSESKLTACVAALVTELIAAFPTLNSDGAFRKIQFNYRREFERQHAAIKAETPEAPSE